MKRVYVRLVLSCILCCCFVRSAAAQEMQATTSSPEALKFFQEGRHHLENLDIEGARAQWRKAVELDPDFTMAHAFLAFLAFAPAEQQEELQKSLRGKDRVSPGERVVVDWLQNSVQGNILPAIQSLNDGLALYPTDKSFNWGAALWLEYRGACDRAIPIYEKILKQDKNFGPAWRGAGDCYMTQRDWSKGLAAMKQYVSLFPHQAGPEIYYGESLAKAGKYDKAVSHCQAALAIDPKSGEAKYCLAQIDALRGDQKRARDEYQQAAGTPGFSMRLRMVPLELGVTYVREGDYKGADQVFTEFAARMHKAGIGTLEAEAYRSMALYHQDQDALDLIGKAEKAAMTGPMDLTTRTGAQARILQAKTLIALHSRNMDMAARAVEDLQQLTSKHLPAAEQCYSGAEGALLLAQGKFEEAASYLVEDPENAFSMQNLLTAYQKSGAKKLAHGAEQALLENHSISLEQALVMQDLRRQGTQMASN